MIIYDIAIGMSEDDNSSLRMKLFYGVRDRVMVLSGTFNNISVILWRSFLPV